VRKRNEAELPHVPELPKTGAIDDDKTKLIQSIFETREKKEKQKDMQEKMREGTR
jgi:hypothetical protein